ncbi:hypothetical protein SDC9_123877 [bioreactor metagenome]|uniref:Uncharacterized protein n=1 Tax=bioreactor metagenome TaxID=1076179 RepID=A0A645CIZ8_9ZZZZ
MSGQYDEGFAAVAEFADQHVAGFAKLMESVLAADAGKEVRKEAANFVNAFLATGSAFGINHGLPKLQHIFLILVNDLICFLFHIHCSSPLKKIKRHLIDNVNKQRCLNK